MMVLHGIALWSEILKWLRGLMKYQNLARSDEGYEIGLFGKNPFWMAVDVQAFALQETHQRQLKALRQIDGQR
jgi:hypothetical protein